MRRTLFKSKIHRATVTQADLDYEGSVTIDAELMRAADILPYEKVHIWNRTNGSRLETYALEAPAGSGVICVNGAAAHHAQPGDIVIIATFARGGRRDRGARLDAQGRARRRAEPHRPDRGRGSGSRAPATDSLITPCLRRAPNR